MRLRSVPLIQASGALAVEGEIVVDPASGHVFIKHNGVLVSATQALQTQINSITGGGAVTIASLQSQIDGILNSVAKLDWQAAIKDIVSVLPTVGLSAGDRYVYIGATGGGLTQNHVYQRNVGSTAWIDVPVDVGTAVYSNADQHYWMYNGTTWVSFGAAVNAGAAGGSYVQGTPVLIGTGDGVNQSFTLPYTGTNDTVWAGGAVQLKPTDYTVSGMTARFGTPPAAGVDVIATSAVFVPASSGTFAQGIPVVIGVGDGSNKDFALPYTGTNETLWAGGAVQVRPADYSVSGGVAHFIAAPAAGVQVVASAAVAVAVNPAGAYSRGTPVLMGVGNGSQTSFPLPYSGGNEQVWEGGAICLRGAGLDFVVSGGNAVFATAPANGSNIIGSADVFVPSGTPLGAGGGGGAMSHPDVVGTGNGTNDTFPLGGSGEELVWRGGAIQVRGLDYNRVGNNAVFVAGNIPATGEEVVACTAQAPIVGSDAITLQGQTLTQIIAAAGSGGSASSVGTHAPGMAPGDLAFYDPATGQVVDSAKLQGKSPGTAAGDIAFYDVNKQVADSAKIQGKSPGQTPGSLAYYDVNNRVVDSEKLGGADLPAVQAMIAAANGKSAFATMFGIGDVATMSASPVDWAVVRDARGLTSFVFSVGSTAGSGTITLDVMLNGVSLYPVTKPTVSCNGGRGKALSTLATPVALAALDDLELRVISAPSGCSDLRADAYSY
jgi:hypothetical protein